MQQVQPTPIEWHDFIPEMKLSAHKISMQGRVWSLREQQLVAPFKYFSAPNKSEDIVLLTFDDNISRYVLVSQLLQINFQNKKHGKQCYPVIQISLDGTRKRWESATAAATGIGRDGDVSVAGAIRNVCSGQRVMTFGYYWEYEPLPLNVNPNEIWRAIPDCDGYEASSEGHIRNSSGYVMQGRDSSGYLRCSNDVLDRVSSYVHVLVALTFYGRPAEEGNWVVHHKDGCLINNRVDNLVWVKRS